MTRRVFAIGAAVAASAAIAPSETKDIEVMFLENPTGDGGLDVAVRGSAEGDTLHVRVFYNAAFIDQKGDPIKVLLSKEATGPWFGRDSGFIIAGNHPFDVKRQDVQFVEVTFLRAISTHRVPVAAIVLHQ